MPSRSRPCLTYGPQPPAFSSDSRWLATFSKGESLKVWSAESWMLERTWTLPGTGQALAFAPEGPRLAVAAHGEAAIWDASTGRKLVTLASPGSSQATQVAWSPDGNRVVTAADDGVLRFWKASDGRLIASLYTLASSRDWLLVAPDGRFDGSERALATLVAWRTGDRVSLDERLTAKRRVRRLWQDLLSDSAERPAPEARKEPSCWPGGAEVVTSDPTPRLLPPPGNELTGVVKRTSVLLKVCIDDKGNVERTFVLRSTGNKNVDAYFQAAAAKWTFKPAQQDGKPVPSVMRISTAWNPRF